MLAHHRLVLPTVSSLTHRTPVSYTIMSSQGSYLSAQKGFLSSSGRGRPEAPKQNFLMRFINAEILAPEKRPGNISIAWGLSVFTVGIIVARKFGDLITPVF